MSPVSWLGGQRTNVQVSKSKTFIVALFRAVLQRIPAGAVGGALVGG